MTRHEILQEMQSEPSGGGMTVIIPSVVMKDPALSRSAKMLYGIITWKCNEFAYCWHSNRALGDELDLSGKRVSALLSELSAQGHIEVEIIKDDGGAIIQRRIYPIVKSSRDCLPPTPKARNPTSKMSIPHPKNRETPTSKMRRKKIKEKRKKKIVPLCPPRNNPGLPPRRRLRRSWTSTPGTIMPSGTDWPTWWKTALSSERRTPVALS